jgi:hypothetical protein
MMVTLTPATRLFAKDADMETLPPFTRSDRLRRSTILCLNFSRNLAFYCASEESPDLLEISHPTSEFWITTRGNFIDLCVLDWCKLFCDHRGEHNFLNVVTDPTEFKDKLIRFLCINETSFSHYCESMSHYRNKFIAHLDKEKETRIPNLDLAFSATVFYHNHIIVHEAKNNELNNLPHQIGELRTCYVTFLSVAKQVYGVFD